MINIEQFKKLFPRAVYMPDTYNSLSSEMELSGITPGNRQNYFLAQLAHECVGFKYIKELGGPSYFKKMYDINGNKPRLARRLGNINPGDGAKYPGRGWIQLTGRYNYQLYSKKLNIPGLDLEKTPELAGTPAIAAKLACLYWTDHGCNSLADSGQFVSITKRINGGINGLADRRRWLGKITQTLN